MYFVAVRCCHSNDLLFALRTLKFTPAHSPCTHAPNLFTLHARPQLSNNVWLTSPRDWQVNDTQSTSMRALAPDLKARQTQIDVPVGTRFGPIETKTPLTRIVGEVYQTFQGMGRFISTYVSVATLTLDATILCDPLLSSFIMMGLMISLFLAYRLKQAFQQLALSQRAKVWPPTTSAYSKRGTESLKRGRDFIILKQLA